jgi:hypothetical protein
VELLIIDAEKLKIQLEETGSLLPMILGYVVPIDLVKLDGVDHFSKYHPIHILMILLINIEMIR